MKKKAVKLSEIIPGVLYLGPARPRRQLKGMKAIVNLARRSYDGQRRHFPLKDGREHPMRLIQATAIIRRRIQGGRIPVYVHCHAGVSRSPTVVALYLARYEAFTFKDALWYVYRHHDKASPNARILMSARIAARYLKEKQS